MKKKIILLILLIVICFLIFLGLKNNLNINKILESIETNTGINIKLEDNQKLTYYPKVSYQNNLSIYGNNGNLIIENSIINITRNYGLTSPTIIKYQSPSILYKGINFRNSKIDSEYNNRVINLNKFSASIIDGTIDINGYLSTNKKKQITLNGSYNNISINRILKQLKIANWERVKIKLSSHNFSLHSINGTIEEIIENLNGEMDINGSIFFVSKEEERFGAAFLSLLTEKFIKMKSLSQSINYILDKFADLPSNITGKININKGILTTEKLLIENKKEKALLTASIDLKSNKIKGKIDLYKDDIIFLNIEIKGDIENPEILISGKIFKNKDDNKTQNIKKIFDEGIQSLIDNILNLNE